MKITYRILFLFGLLSLIFCSSLVAEDQFHSDMVRFWGNSSILYMPFGVTAIIFDTSSAQDTTLIVPEWKLIGNLKIDSIRYFDTIFSVGDLDQLDSISVNSIKLIQVLESIQASKLMKGFSKAKPEDTLFWDNIRKKWHNLPDLSKYYIIKYNEKIEPDSVIKLLYSVPNISKTEKIFVPPSFE